MVSICICGWGEKSRKLNGKSNMIQSCKKKSDPTLSSNCMIFFSFRTHTPSITYTGQLRADRIQRLEAAPEGFWGESLVDEDIISENSNKPSVEAQGGRGKVSDDVDGLQERREGLRTVVRGGVLGTAAEGGPRGRSLRGNRPAAGSDHTGGDEQGRMRASRAVKDHATLSYDRFAGVSAGRGHGTDTARADTNGGGRHRQLSLGRRLAMGVFTAEDDTTLNKYDFPRDKAPVPADSGRPSSSEADDLASLAQIVTTEARRSLKRGSHRRAATVSTPDTHSPRQDQGLDARARRIETLSRSHDHAALPSLVRRPYSSLRRRKVFERVRSTPRNAAGDGVGGRRLYSAFQVSSISFIIILRRFFLFLIFFNFFLVPSPLPCRPSPTLTNHALSAPPAPACPASPYPPRVPRPPRSITRLFGP